MCLYVHAYVLCNWKFVEFTTENRNITSSLKSQYMFVYIYLKCIKTYMCLRILIYIYMYIYIYIYINLYIYIYVCIYCICIYINTFIFLQVYTVYTVYIIMPLFFNDEMWYPSRTNISGRSERGWVESLSQWSRDKHIE
jgi:hypothetical protein